MKMKREGNKINRRETSKESHTPAGGEGTGQRAQRTCFYLLGETPCPQSSDKTILHLCHSPQGGLECAGPKQAA